MAIRTLDWPRGALVALVVATTCVSGLDIANAGPPCLQTRVTAADPGVFDSFGFAVATSGSRSLMGAMWNDDMGVDSGSAYVFRRQSSGWAQVQKLVPTDGQAQDYFGRAVAVEGDFALVGAIGDDDTGLAAGSAYLFHHNGATWIQQQKLVTSDGAAQDLFGYSLALNSDVAIIGAPGHDALGANAGAVYIFRYNPATAWLQQQKLQASDGQAGDSFGFAVSVRGDVALIGAAGDGDLGGDSGSAYIFRYDPKTSLWVQEQKLLASDGTFSDGFGCSVSLSGDTALIGARGDIPLVQFNLGSAYVFRHDSRTGQWVQSQKLIPPDSWAQQFGFSVSLDGPLAVIGAQASTPPGLGQVGAAYVYRLNPQSQQWLPHGPALVPPLGGGPFFGFSVGLSGTTAVVGAYGENGQRGAAYIYNADPVPADLNCDGVVNTLDLGIVLSNWSIPPTGPGCAGDSPCLADLNIDGLVNTLDLGILLSSWTLK